jgi:hypothetical protein
MTINKENLPKKMWQSLAVSGQFGNDGKAKKLFAMLSPRN